MTVASAREPGFLAALGSRLAGVGGGEVVEADLAGYSTYRIGGPAAIVTPANEAGLVAALGVAADAGVPVFPLGLGSNVLLPDQGLDALVLRAGKGLDQVRQEGATWWLGAGLPAPLAARRTAQAGWAGLHMMVGVPGTVGGGVYMNAGCHGGEWAAVVRRVRVTDRSGVVSVMEREAIPFRYRRSGLGERIVLEAEVELEPADPAALADEVKELLAWRQRGTPFTRPCCGSVFQNPAWPEAPPSPDRRTAGQLIEACGLKGTRIGAIEISPMHANYFVNTGGGRAEEVRQLMALATEKVRDRFGVTLVPEVKVIGRTGEWLDNEGGGTDA